jgi:hypothetical protein
LLKYVHAQNLQDLRQTKFQSKLFADDGDQHVNADGNPDLRLDRVVTGAEKVFDPQILLDPFEEQFHLPAALVQLGNGEWRQVEVIGEKDQGLAGLRVSISTKSL